MHRKWNYSKDSEFRAIMVHENFVKGPIKIFIMNIFRRNIAIFWKKSTFEITDYYMTWI